MRAIMTMEDARDGSTSTYDLRARARVTTQATETGVKLVVKLCDVRLPVVSGYQPELDASFVAALPALTITGAVAGGMITTEPAALVLGAQLANPLTSALPADGTSTRVKDQDQDGNPGVSISIPGYGKIYAALRVKVSLTAAVEMATAFDGEAEFAMDQAIYGDDIWFYDAQSSAAETAANVTVAEANNTFRMKAGPTTCAQVRSALQ